MRFSIWLGTEQTWEEIVTSAEHASGTGWGGIWLADHFMPNGARSSVPRLEAWYGTWDYPYSKGVVLEAAPIPDYLQAVSTK